jgi:cardiolipin synthase (CMP-forming)
MHTASGYINLPNAVSVARLPLAAAFWLLPSPSVRIAVLVLAGFSDWLDGRLARRAGGSVPGGEALDPIMDKAFIVAVVVVLFSEGRLPAADLLMLLVRDVLVVCATALAIAAGHRPQIRARMSGKIVTGLQLAALLGAVAWTPAVRPLAIATAIAGAVSFADYSHHAWRSLHSTRPPA